MAEGLGLIGFDGKIDNTLLKNNLIFTQATIHDPIRIALPPEDAKQWFGTVPRDLSLITREKGKEWLYTYLNSFYEDNSKLWGTNNYLVPDVAMPNILETLSNDLSNTQLDSNLKDLVAFLAYVGEPVQLRRYRLGVLVIGFLVVLFYFSLRLQSIYWRKSNVK
jgi:ubiquinol-cytochrome c reductase cytochrome c1 subunit